MKKPKLFGGRSAKGLKPFPNGKPELQSIFLFEISRGKRRKDFSLLIEQEELKIFGM